MKKILLLSVALLSFVSVMATVIPTTSTTGNEVWYHIKCSARNTPAAVWLTGAAEGGNLTIEDLTSSDDSQLWKIVTSSAGYALVNKQYGTYMNTDLATLSHVTAVSILPPVALQFVPSSKKSGGVLVADVLTTFDPVTNVATSIDTYKFIFYAAGSVYSFHPINYLAANPPLEYSSVYFMTTKEMLFDEIKSANATLNSISSGAEPGQFSADVITDLKYYIDDAQSIYDDINSTDEQLLAAVFDLKFGLVNVKSQVILPKISDVVNYWYYIQGTRPANTYMTAPAAGAGTQVKDNPVIPDETQLWRLVTNGDGFALQNKGSMEYLVTDVPTGTNLPTQTTIPTKPLRFIASSETFNKSVRFWIENTVMATEAYRLHAGGSGNGWGVMNWTGNATDNCTWLFLSEDELFRANFSAAKTAARNAYTNSVEGSELGQYSATSRTAFNAIISTEEAKDISAMTREQLQAGQLALETALANFKCNSDLSSLNDVTKVKWFRLISNPDPTVTYCYGKAMTSATRLVDVSDYTGKFTYLAKDVNSDAQLFTFIMNSDGTKAVAIKNKANGYYVGFDGHILSAPEAGAEFEITSIDRNSFWIKPSGNSPLHAASYNTEIVNWDAGSGSASAWMFEYVSSESVADLTIPYTTKRTNVRTQYDAVSTVKGADFGMYSTTSVDALGVVLSAEEAKDVATLSQAQMLQGITDMQNAASALVVNTDIKLLVSQTVGMTKWYRLVNGASASSASYASGKAMTSNGRVASLNEKFTFEDVDINSDAQLFKFELSSNLSKIANVVNKADTAYLGYDGTMYKLAQTNNEFEITQLSGGRTFWIYPTYVDNTDPANPYRVDPIHAAEANSEILNWYAGVGSASAWYLQFVKEETSAVRNVSIFNNTVRIINNIISIDGVSHFEVYSLLGQKQNRNKALSKGVYFVKVSDTVKKVVIE